MSERSAMAVTLLLPPFPQLPMPVGKVSLSLGGVIAPLLRLPASILQGA